MTHKCEENRIPICSICHFEMSKERNLLLEFVKEVEQWQIPLAIMARKLLKEIGEDK